MLSNENIKLMPPKAIDEFMVNIFCVGRTCRKEQIKVMFHLHTNCWEENMNTSLELELKTFIILLHVGFPWWHDLCTL
jgi:hypothetical protein